MKRVIVLGGLGLFGRTTIELLASSGITALSASRRNAADLKIDANDAASIRATLRAGDLVVDTGGPFQSRSSALIESAIDIGFDVIDLNDSIRYAEMVAALAPRIDAAGIRILSAASTLSAVSATVLRHIGVSEPRRVFVFLAPATRYTANAGSGASLIESVGRPIRIWRDGRFCAARGWTEPRPFPMPAPVGPICGRLFESADAFHLPRIWPSLRNVEMHVDTNTPGMNAGLCIGALIPGYRAIMKFQMPFGTWVARQFGAAAGGVGYEIEDDAGNTCRYAIHSGQHSHWTALAPAVLAARSILADRFPHRGLVPPDRHVEPADLFEFLQINGLQFTEIK